MGPKQAGRQNLLFLLSEAFLSRQTAILCSSLDEMQRCRQGAC